jgi:hypothetical protein
MEEIRNAASGKPHRLSPLKGGLHTAFTLPPPTIHPIPRSAPAGPSTRFGSNPSPTEESSSAAELDPITNGKAPSVAWKGLGSASNNRGAAFVNPTTRLGRTQWLGVKFVGTSTTKVLRWLVRGRTTFLTALNAQSRRSPRSASIAAAKSLAMELKSAADSSVALIVPRKQRRQT